MINLMMIDWLINFLLISVDRLQSDPPGIVRVNLGRMLILYVKRFYRSDPMEALHYYYQLL
jgi:hypothetical protein